MPRQPDVPGAQVGASGVQRISLTLTCAVRPGLLVNWTPAPAEWACPSSGAAVAEGTVLPARPLAVTDNLLPSCCHSGALAAALPVCAGLMAGMTGIGAACANAHAGRAKAKPVNTALASNRRILEPEQTIVHHTSGTENRTVFGEDCTPRNYILLTIHEPVGARSRHTRGGHRPRVTRTGTTGYTLNRCGGLDHTWQATFIIWLHRPASRPPQRFCAARSMSCGRQPTSMA